MIEPHDKQGDFHKFPIDAVSGQKPLFRKVGFVSVVRMAFFIPVRKFFAWAGIAEPLLDGWWELTMAEVVLVAGFIFCLFFPLSAISDDKGNIVGSFWNYLDIAGRASGKTLYVLAAIFILLSVVASGLGIISDAEDISALKSSQEADYVLEDVHFFMVLVAMGIFCFFSAKEGYYE